MKENKLGSIILIVSLLLFLIGGYTTIYFNFVDDINKNVPPTKKEEKVEISEEDLNELISSVPYGIGITIEEEYSSSLNVDKDNFNSKDGYSGKYVIRSNIDERILINNIFYRSTLSTKPFNSSIMVNGIKFKCTENMALYEEVRLNYKKIYNKDLNLQYFNAIPSLYGLLVKSDNLDYICQMTTKGTTESKLVTKINKYEAKGDELFIYTKAAIIIDNKGSASILKDTLNKKVVTEIIDSEGTNNYMEDAKFYVENNWNSFSTFKHTFIKEEDRYIWQSSELA